MTGELLAQFEDGSPCDHLAECAIGNRHERTVQHRMSEEVGKYRYREKLTAPVAVCRRDRGSERRLWKPSRPLLAMTLRRGLPGLDDPFALVAGRFGWPEPRRRARADVGPISAAPGGQERVDAGGGGRGCDCVTGMQPGC